MGHSSVYLRYKRPETNDKSKQKLLRIDQVSDRLSCSKSYVYKLIEEGKLKCLKLEDTKGIRVCKKEVEFYKQKRIDQMDLGEENQ